MSVLNFQNKHGRSPSKDPTDWTVNKGRHPAHGHERQHFVAQSKQGLCGIFAKSSMLRAGGRRR